MKYVLAIGWSYDELSTIAAELTHYEIELVCYRPNERLNERLSKDFSLILICKREGLTTWRQLKSILVHPSTPTIVFEDKALLPQTSTVDHEIQCLPLDATKIVFSIHNLDTRISKLDSERGALLEFDRFMSVFRKTIDHEFNTPINILKGSAHLLQEFYHQLTEEDITEQVAQIGIATQRLEDLISEIRLQMTLETNPKSLNIGPTPLRSILSDVVKSLGHKRTDWETRIRVLSNDAGQKVQADPTFLFEALKRIITNALENSSDPVEIRIASDAQTTRLEIEDRGIGISSEKLEAIFLPYTRFGNVDAHQGIGLGLSIAQKSIHLFGGKIEVASTPGEGSCFSIVLQKVASLTQV